MNAELNSRLKNIEERQELIIQLLTGKTSEKAIKTGNKGAASLGGAARKGSNINKDFVLARRRRTKFKTQS